ncbi:MAG: hypothetical protein OJF50_001598 [Nitrospira sp.]|nr:hypothetical protein [Nitrospira sp.]
MEPPCWWGNNNALLKHKAIEGVDIEAVLSLGTQWRLPRFHKYLRDTFQHRSQEGESQGRWNRPMVRLYTNQQEDRES